MPTHESRRPRTLRGWYMMAVVLVSLALPTQLLAYCLANRATTDLAYGMTAPATWEGYATCKRKYPATKSHSAAFWDIGRGECWSCPTRYKRTIFPVHRKKACERPAYTVYKKAKRHGRGKGLLRTKCPRGQFWDPKGYCYSCPRGYKRTAHAVTSRKSCSKRIPVRRTVAKLRGKRGCAKGAFRNGLYDACYSCPTGFARTINMGRDLTTMPNACKAKKAYRLKSQTEICCDWRKKSCNSLRRLRGGKPSVSAPLVVHMWEPDRYCGFHKPPKRIAKVGKLPTPGPTPAQKNCQVGVFNLEARGLAVVTGRPSQKRDEQGGFEVTFYNPKGVFTDSMQTYPFQPPPPGPLIEAEAGSFHGGWTTSRGNLTLKQQGGKVSGVLHADKIRIRLVGLVSGRTLTGRWLEPPSYEGKEHAGDFRFALSKDGRSFEGQWNTGALLKLNNTWTGRRGR